jgi:CBS domain-containing protein
VSDATAVTLGEVFVPGGLPRVTYNPREALQLEQRVRDYLDERHKLLSLSGPTKSGKTVLLRTVLPPAVWISGGSIETSNDFWGSLVDGLGVPTGEQAETSREESVDRGAGVGVGVGLPNVVYVEGKATTGTTTSTGQRRTVSFERSLMQSALAEIRKRPRDTVIVIDDFHYVEPELQLQIIRALKEPVFDGVAVILASVPHRAFDVVRIEKEMTGRVDQLPIDFWSDDELRGIAEKGFDALNLLAPNEVIERLARESFGSPHLMQEFCLDSCKGAGIRGACATPTELPAPASRNEFFGARASAASKSAFDLLKQGPRQRTDRKERILADGTVSDIYGVVLAAIAATGPKTSLSYNELRASIREVLSSDPPQRHETTRVLEEMTKIAREKIAGEPVVDFDVELETLYISDPFFAYFLRWGAIRSELIFGRSTAARVNCVTVRATVDPDRGRLSALRQRLPAIPELSLCRKIGQGHSSKAGSESRQRY